MDEPLSKPNIMSSDFDRRTTLSSFATIYGIGYLSYMLMPLQIGALIESLALNEAQAGVIATAELLSLALALFVIAPRIASFSRLRLGQIGAGLVMLGHTLSACCDSYSMLIVCRIITGLGAGGVLAAGNAVVASSARPQRLFAFIFTIGQMQAACLLFVMPLFISRWGHSGAYGFLAGWTVIMFILLQQLPANTDSNEKHVTERTGMNWRVLFLPTVIALTLVGTSDASLWTFQERIATSLGLDQETIGLVLGGALVSGMLGSGLSTLLGARFGIIIPVCIGFTWMALCYLMITITASANLYIFFELSYLFAYGFVIPYLFGINGELDKSGGAMVAANACNLAGISLGPIFAGFLIVKGGYPIIGMTICSMIIMAMLLYLSTARKLSADLPQT